MPFLAEFVGGVDRHSMNVLGPPLCESGQSARGSDGEVVEPLRAETGSPASQTLLALRSIHTTAFWMAWLTTTVPVRVVPALGPSDRTGESPVWASEVTASPRSKRI